MMLFVLSFFGIKKVKQEHFHILCKNTKSGVLYFKCYDKGIAEFTLDKPRSWKFDSPEEARRARAQMGLCYKDIYIQEVRKI